MSGSQAAALLVALALLAGGCGRQQPPATGTLEALPGEAPAQVEQRGEGNMVRPVQGASLAGGVGVELAAGGGGQVRYLLEAPAGADLVAEGRFLLRSTQGTGRLLLEEVDAAGGVRRSVGWVYTGAWPGAGDGAHRWVDARYGNNYQGDWVEARYGAAALLERFFSGGGPLQGRCRWVLEVGEGQHALVNRFALAPQAAAAVSVTAPARLELRQGEGGVWRTRLLYTGSQEEVTLQVALQEPRGYGVTVRGERQRPVRLRRGEAVELAWELEARRPDRVNFGQPWELALTVAGEPKATAAASVAATRPGSVYYVMTEDLEPIDGAGYAAAWGNRDGWLNPEELEVQLVAKAEALNAVAARHGALWTHYIAWPAVAAAQWAQGQSATGRWGEAAAAVAHSVSQESRKGHEYGVHMHSDYDPFLEGNVLSYYAPADGLWANHLRHGWAYSLAEEGDYGDRGSRLGSLYAYQRILDELAADSPQGQLLTARAGSFDFGGPPASQAMSSRVFRRLGLWGSSDAAGNVGGLTAAPYGRELYLAAREDIGRPAARQDEAGVVQLRPTPQPPIAYDQQPAAAMNAKADEGMRAFSREGRILPGVHGIIGFTHAMFVLGEGDWRSTAGGQFAALDEHLAYLKERYVDRGLLRFATASQLVRAFLDEESLEAVALYGRRLERGWWRDTYAVELLGRDLPVSPARPQQVRLKVPLYLREDAFRAEVRKDGAVVAAVWNLAAADGEIAFAWDDKEAAYTLTVYRQPWVRRALAALRQVRGRL